MTATIICAAVFIALAAALTWVIAVLALARLILKDFFDVVKGWRR